ncbi:MAG: acetoacetate decarboxylase family protein [Francisella endosymbiont of Hyalomma asiaticum]
MPLVSPTVNRVAYKFTNREYFIIDYIADIEALKKYVPKPLKPTGLVKFEFMKMYNANGFSCFNEAEQLIEVRYGGKKGLYSLAYNAVRQFTIYCRRS